MKTALILGITGGFGRHMAESLAQRGWRLRALMRDVTKLPSRFASAERIAGDVGRIDDLRRAAAGTQLMVYGVNAPYEKWEHTVLPWLENAARVAEENKLSVVFPGNVYNYDPTDGPVIDEHTPMRPITPKGRLRQAMEDRLRHASTNGARVLIVRAGNFIGADTRSTWLAHLIRPTQHGFSLSATGPRDLRHAWAYLPDLSETVATLLSNADALPAFSVFHFKGHEASFSDLAAAIREATGKPVTMKTFPWWFLRMIAPFSRWNRSLLEMRYLWNHPVLLNDTKLTRVLNGAIPNTPLAIALARSGLLVQEDAAGPSEDNSISTERTT